MSNCRALTYLFASMLVLVQTSLPALAQSANNSLIAPQLTTPNYWGDSRVQSVGMGDYRNPYTGNQVYDNGTTFTNRSLPQNYNSTYYTPRNSNNGGGGRGNGMGLVMGAGAIGGAALLMNAGRMASMRRGGFHPGSTDPTGYQKDMAEGEKRRQKQEEKLHAELAKAHQENLRRKGQLNPEGSTLANAPQGAPAGNGEFTPVDNKPESMVSERGLASQKFDQPAEPIPGDSAQALSF